MTLIWHESIHFFVNLLIALFIFYRYKSWKLVLIVFLVGIFLDIDHLVDLLLANGNLSDIITGYYFASSQKAYVLLHSWELLILWWIYIIYSKKFDLGWAVTLAFLGHVFIDQFSYSTYLLTYFFSYRILVDFQLDKLFF